MNMRILNKKVPEGEIDMYFGVTLTPSIPNQLYLRWLKQVWIQNLIKTDPGWAFPVQIEEPLAMFSGLKVPPLMYVDIPGQPRQKIYPENEWDTKDARAGILYYYSRSRNTLAQYSQTLVPFQEYLTRSLFADKPVDYDVRRHRVPDVERAIPIWRQEEEQRMLSELRAANTQAENDNNPYWSPISAKSLKEGVDFKVIGRFAHENGTEYSIVRLLSPNALDVEGSAMWHCIGRYYKEYLGNGLTILGSLRKSSELDKPLVTFELTVTRYSNRASYNMIQVQGKHDHNPNQTIPGSLENTMVWVLKHCDPADLDPTRPVSSISQAQSTKTFVVT